MAIVDNTDYNALIVEMQERAERINRAIIRTFQYIAEVLVREARMKGDYIDQTGNLRSSIGAIILLDGQIVSRSGFEVVMGGSSGTNEGLTYAQQIAAAYPRGVALVVVAGMNYAAHVAARGRDVLSSAVLKAEDIIPRMMRQLNLN